MIFYFSATGNSKYVAERLATATDDKTISIEECMTTKRFLYDVPDGERIGFVMPTYFYGMPKIVEEFLDNVQLFTKGDNYVYLALTMGGSCGTACKAFRNKMSERGICTDAFFGIVMPDTWTPMFDLTDTEANMRVLEAADKEVDEVIAAVTEKRKGDFNKHKGVWGIFTSFTRMAYRRESTEKFDVSESCVGCGLCEKVCPDQAIAIKGGRPVWTKESCNFCLRCLHRCPKFAISFGKNSRKHGQYTNPNVSL